MTRQDVARVLDIERALDERFAQVAPSAKDGTCESQTYPLPGIEYKEIARGYIGGQCGYNETTPETFPRFLGRYALKKAVLANGAAHEIGSCVVEPNENKKRQEYEW